MNTPSQTQVMPSQTTDRPIARGPLDVARSKHGNRDSSGGAGRAIKVLALRYGRRWPTWIASALLASLFGAALVLYRRDPVPVAYFIAPVENLTGKGEIDSAASSLPDAVAMRVGQIAEAMDTLFIKVPAEEFSATEGTDGVVPTRAKIRLQNRREAGALSGLPVDHFLFEWAPRLSREEQRAAALRIDASSADAQGNAGERTAHVRLTLRDPQNDTFSQPKPPMVVVTVVLNKETCEHTVEDVIKDGSTKGGARADLAPVVDAVATCVLLHHLRTRVAWMTGKDTPTLEKLAWRRFSERAKQHVLEFYESILSLGDRKRQRELLVGIERYAYFASHWEDERTEAMSAEEDAVDHFYAAAGVDDASPNLPRYPLAEYLYVHAETARVLGIPEPIGRAGKQQKPRHDIQNHVGRAFQLAPYHCARWANALALGAFGRQTDALDAWEQIGEAEADGKTSGAGEMECDRSKEQGLRMRAKAQKAAVLFQTGAWDRTLQTRINLLKGVLKPQDPSTTAERELEAAAILFESAVDALVLFEAAAVRHEVLPIDQHLVSFAEGDGARMRASAAIFPLIVESAAAAGLAAASTLNINTLKATSEKLEQALAACRTGATACSSLRAEVQQFLVAFMDLSHTVAMILLEQSQVRLDRAQVLVCKGEPLAECQARSASAAPVASASPPPSEGSWDQARSANREQRRVSLLQIRDMRTQALSYAWYQRCHALWRETDKPGGRGERFIKDIEAPKTEIRDTLQRSPLSPLLGEQLGYCAVVSLAADTAGGERLLSAHRSQTLPDIWARHPPSSEPTWKMESALRRQGFARVVGADKFLALLRYPAILNAAMAAAKVGTHHDRTAFQRYLYQVIALVRPGVMWKAETDLNGLWTRVMDDEAALRAALGATGKALVMEIDRGEGQVSNQIGCREALALRACDPKAAKDVPDECAEIQHPATCPLDHERQRFDAWVAAVVAAPPSAPAPIQDAMIEGEKRAKEARGLLEGKLDTALQAVATRFHESINKATAGGDRGDDHVLVALDLALVRVSVWFATGGRSGAQPLQGAGPRTLDRLVARSAQAGQAEQLQALVMPDRVQAAARARVTFRTKQSAQPIGTEPEAIAELARETHACWGAGSSEQKRWMRRFFAHVLLNRHWYAADDAADRRAAPMPELTTAYNTWCGWGVDDGAPLVVDDALLEIVWTWQSDAIGETGDVLPNSDELGKYLAARVLWSVEKRRPDPVQAAEDLDRIARDLKSHEGLLLRARIAVARGAGAEAVTILRPHYASLAKRPLLVLDDRLHATMAHAFLLLGVHQEADGARGSYGDALEAYDHILAGRAVADEPMLARLHAAAAAIERREAHAALSILHADLPENMSFLSRLQWSVCSKRHMMMAIAELMRGRVEVANAKAARLDITYDDLSRSTGDGPCDGEVPIGPLAAQFGRQLVDARSPKGTP